jgi:ATP-dependent helicase/DNAse subunit B
MKELEQVIQKVSASRFASFNSCELRFFLDYFTDIQCDQDDTKYLDIGIYIHNMISDFYKKISVEELKRLVNTQSSMKSLSKTILVKLQEMGLLDEITDNPKLIKHWRLVMESVKGFCNYIRDSCLKIKQTNKQFELLIPVINEEYFKRKISVEIDNEEYKAVIGGYVDAAFPIGEGVKIVDWKTSNAVESNDYYMSQLYIYQYLVEKSYDVFRISNVFVRTNAIDEHLRHKNISNYIEEIYKNFVIRVKEAYYNDSWKTNGQWCDYCPYKGEFCIGNSKVL